MKIELSFLIMATASLLAAGTASGPKATPPLRQPLTGWQVWPASGERIFETTQTPTSCTNAAVDVVSARGADTSASFAIRSSTPVSALSLELSRIVTDNGIEFPVSSIDIRVVKIWYQDGNGWFSGKRGQGVSTLVPELLLHDDTLVMVDKKACANLVRTATGGYRRIDAPNGGELAAVHSDFVAADDAKSLQPLEFGANETRQFFVNIKIQANTQAGLYHGRINVNGNGKTLGYIALNMRILPHVLPAADSRFSDSASIDGAKIFLGGSPAVLQANSPLPFLSIAALPERLTTPETFQFLLNSGISSPVVPPSKAASAKSLFGTKTPSVLWVAGYSELLGENTTIPSVPAAIALAKSALAAGVTDTRVFLPSQVSGPAMTNALPALKAVADAGAGPWFMANDESFVPTAEFASAPMQAGVEIRPENSSQGSGGAYGYREYSSTLQIERWHNLGLPNYMYVVYPTAIEDYAMWRRHLGLECYWQGFEGFVLPTLVETVDPWNDWADLSRRSRTIIYPTQNGFISTLAWEGVRDAITDTRYLSSVTRLADKIRYLKQKDICLDIAGCRASMFVDWLNPRKSSPDTLRLDAMAWISRLEALLMKNGVATATHK